MRELADIEREIINNIESEFNQNIPENKISLLRYMAKAVAAQAYNLYLHIEKTKNEVFPQTATEEGLMRWGEMVQIVRRPAVAADIIVMVRNRAPNAVLERGTRVISAGNIEFTSQRTMTFGAAGTSIPVLFTCTQVGEIGNIGHSEGGRFVDLEFEEQQLDFETNISVFANVTIGQDQETVSSFRNRIVERFYSRDLTGTVAWYKNILIENQFRFDFTILDVFPYSSSLIPGQIIIYVQIDNFDEESNTNNYQMTDAQKAEVAEFFELPDYSLLYFSARLLNEAGEEEAKIKIESPIIQEIKVTIEDLVATYPDEMQGSINIAVQQYLANKKPFVSGIHSTDRSYINLSELIVHVDSTIKQVERDATFAKLKIDIVDGAEEVTKYQLPAGTLVVLSNNQQVYFTDTT